MDDGVIGFASAAVPCSNKSEPPLSLQLNNSSYLPQGPDQLSAILEQPPIGRSRPSSVTSAPMPMHLTSAFSPEPRASLTGPAILGIGPSPQDHNELTRATKQKRRFICKVVGKLARRIDDAPHEVKFLGLRLHYRLTSDYLSENQPCSPAAALPSVDESPTSISDQEPSQGTSSVLDVGPISAEPVEEGESLLSYGQHNDAKPDPTRQAHIGEEYPNQDAILKSERLRIERREKTLKARALRKNCECTEECHCKREGREPSNSDSTRRSHSGNMTRSGTPRSFQWVPAHPLGDLIRRLSVSSESNPLPNGARPDPFTHVGGFHIPRWRRSNTANSSSAGDTSSGPGQASNATSNTSSLSLHPSGPVLPGRSFSASLLPFSVSSSGHDFGTREVLRSLEFLHHARAVAAGPTSLPRGPNGSFSRTMELAEPDGNSTSAYPPSPRTLLSSSGSHPTGQGSQPQVDGFGSSSSNSSPVRGPARESGFIVPEPHASQLNDGTAEDVVTELSSLPSDNTTRQATGPRWQPTEVPQKHDELE